MSDDDLVPSEMLGLVFPALKKPVATRKAILAMVAQIEHDLLSPPWYAKIKWHDCRKGDFAGDEDTRVYACVETQPQYHRMLIHVDRYHPGWNQERSLAECLRHEVFHSFVNQITAFAYRFLTEPKDIEDLEEREDDCVNRLAALPILRRQEESYAQT